MARHELLRAQEYQKKYADQKRCRVHFKEGQRVFLKATNFLFPDTSEALRPRFVAPFTIVRTVAENTAMLDLRMPWLVHPVFPVAMLSAAEEEAPKGSASAGASSGE